MREAVRVRVHAQGGCAATHTLLLLLLLALLQSGGCARGGGRAARGVAAPPACPLAPLRSLTPPPTTHTDPPTHPQPLQYFRKKKTLLRHLAKCTLRHPPGDEIYRSPPPPASDPTYVGDAGERPNARVDRALPPPRAPSTSPCALLPPTSTHTRPPLPPAPLPHTHAHTQCATPPSRCSRWTAKSQRCTARISACCPSCSWTTRPSTMM